MRIWKFPLQVADTQTLKMPEGTRIMTVQVKGETPCIWVVVDEAAPVTDVTMRMFATGESIPNLSEDSHLYVGTFQLEAEVYHVFVENR